jgi:hypothetical protein
MNRAKFKEKIPHSRRGRYPSNGYRAAWPRALTRRAVSAPPVVLVGPVEHRRACALGVRACPVRHRHAEAVEEIVPGRKHGFSSSSVFSHSFVQRTPVSNATVLFNYFNCRESNCKSVWRNMVNNLGNFACKSSGAGARGICQCTSSCRLFSVFRKDRA